MKNLWKIIFLVAIWCGLGGNFGLLNIVLGVCIAAFCCLIFQPKQPLNRKIHFGALIWLLCFVLVELFKSSLLVTWEVITPKQKSQPQIIHVDLACNDDIERTVLANLLSLTPGTLSIDLSEDKAQLIVHVMFAHDHTQAINFIKHSLEPKVMKVFNDATT